MKQQKYIMFTKLQLETMLKIADQKKIGDEILGAYFLARFESAGKNYPGQLQFSKDFEKKIYENYNEE